MEEQFTYFPPPDNTFIRLAEFYLDHAMAEELNGLAGCLDRIRISPASHPALEIPGDDPDEPERLKELTGVILYHHPVFAYYPNKFTDGSNPPACLSYDGLTGVGQPGGNCSQCPLNQFGSGSNGGKACQNRHRLFILREGEVFPLQFTLPTGSLCDLASYVQRLLSRGKKSNAVISRLMLKRVVTGNGQTGVRVRFILARDLQPDEYKLIRKLSANVRIFSKNIGVDLDSLAEPWRA